MGILTTDAEARFDALQERLVALWPAISTWSDDEQDVVVVPSYSVDAAILEQVGPLLTGYEERFLYMLLLLRQPNCRLVFVTSTPVRPRLIDAYLALIPDTRVEDARSRLTFITPDDPSQRPLAAKLLERPGLIERIGSAVRDRMRAHLAMFIVTDAERDLALRLGLPIFGSAPRHATFGTKAGCRAIFADEGVPHPRGEAVASEREVDEALGRLRDLGATSAVVKLNEGVSGLGNAIVFLDTPDAPGVPAAITSQLPVQGGIVEELITDHDLRSPSAQLRITPPGDLEILSTHDQLLGGPSGQVYLGCVFPADAAYAPLVAAEAEKVGRRLAREGVRGRFAVDFVARRRGDEWDVFAIEINLRKGGTTHPFLTMHFLVDGSYDAASGAYRAPDGSSKHYVGVDALGFPGLQSVPPEDVLSAAHAAGISYDAHTQTGVVFHMLSALPAGGKFGLTAIAGGREQAQRMCRQAADLVGTLAEHSV